MRYEHVIAVALAVAISLTVGIWWCVCDMPEPVAPLETDVTGSDAGGKIPVAVYVDPETAADFGESRAEVDSVDVPEDPEPTEQERVLAVWEQSFDVFVKRQDDETWKPAETEIAQFKALFDKMDVAQRLEQIPHAQNLFSDASFGFLKAILMDPTEPQEVLESIYYDLLNRPEELKYPILREVYAVPVHPLRGEIEELAGVLGEMAQLSNE